MIRNIIIFISALQIAVKTREVKSKGEKERYKHLNAEFQRIARRDKKACLSDQQQNGKDQRSLQENRDTKGTFHAKMGSIKDKNMDLTEVEDIKKWQEYTKELYKNDLNDPDNHDGVIIHLEPDILESEVMWALGSITTNKANGGDGIPAELFQILKDESVKVCTQHDRKFGKLSSGHRTGKGQFSFQCQRKSMPKNVQITA